MVIDTKSEKCVLLLDEIRDLYNTLDKQCGVDTSNVKIEWSNKLKIFGYCRSHRGYDGNRFPVKIVISTDLLTLDDDAELWDTVRHEYAHAVATLRHPKIKVGHGPIWKAICLEVGANPSRCKKVEWNEALFELDKYKYVIQCDKCGKLYYYLRRGKFVNYCLANADSEGNVPAGHWQHPICKTNGWKILKGM